MSAQRRLDLLIPGLLGPVPVRPQELPSTPALDRLLARANRVPGGPPDPGEALLARFGVPTPAGADPPSAVFALLGDDPGADPGGWWLHADPVHLRPDRDRIRLFDARHLAVTRDEAEALVELFNTHFARDGLRLTAPVPERWYLHAERPPAICTRPLHAAVGCSIDPLLPTGPGARDWARLLNEVQMLFHAAEVNRRRETDGRPAINGLWTWGGGRLPEAPLESAYAEVCAGDPLALGLARAGCIQSRPLPGANDACPLPASGALLWVLEDLWGPVLDADPEGWLAALPDIDSWAADWLAALRGDRLTGLSLDPGTGERYELTPGMLRRFWRRRAPLARRMSAPEGLA